MTDEPGPTRSASKGISCHVDCGGIVEHSDRCIASTDSQQGWDTLSNDDLLAAAVDSMSCWPQTRIYATNRTSQVGKSPLWFSDVGNGRNYARTFNALLTRSMPPCLAAMLRSTFLRP